MTVLHTVEYGDRSGPTLFAVHGVTGHARRWERLAEEAWAHRHVVAVDLRGHGRSTWRPPWSLDQVVDDLVDTLDDLDLGSVDVVGHSYGGALGLHLLARAPARVQRLVMLDPGFSRDPDLMADEAGALLAFDGWADRNEAVAARSAGWLRPDPDPTHASPAGGTAPVLDIGPGSGPHPDVAREIAQHLVTSPDGRLRFRFSIPAAVTIFGELCRPVPAVPVTRPTLLVDALRADVVTPAVRHALEATLGPALVRRPIDAGHMVFWDRFEDTARIVDDFLTPLPVPTP